MRSSCSTVFELYGCSNLKRLTFSSVEQRTVYAWRLPNFRLLFRLQLDFLTCSCMCLRLKIYECVQTISGSYHTRGERSLRTRIFLFDDSRCVLNICERLDEFIVICTPLKFVNISMTVNRIRLGDERTNLLRTNQLISIKKMRYLLLIL